MKSDGTAQQWSSPLQQMSKQELLRLEAMLARFADELDDADDEKTIRYAAIIAQYEMRKRD